MEQVNVKIPMKCLQGYFSRTTQGYDPGEYIMFEFIVVEQKYGKDFNFFHQNDLFWIPWVDTKRTSAKRLQKPGVDFSLTVRGKRPPYLHGVRSSPFR